MVTVKEKAPSVPPNFLYELNQLRLKADADVYHAASEVQGSLSNVYATLARELAEDALRPKRALPPWMQQVDEASIMVYPGSPVEPGLALQIDGALTPVPSFTGYQPPNSKPLQGIDYLTRADNLLKSLLTRLQPKENGDRSQEILA